MMIDFENNDEGKTVNFLLTEYNQAHNDWTRQREAGLNRLNFHITITSSIIGGLVVLGGIDLLPPNTFHVISIGALIFLLLLGWHTFQFGISREINSDKLLRVMARIRRYFVDQNASVVKYLTWQIHDEPTRLLTRNTSRIRRTLQTVISFTFAVAVALSANLINNGLAFTLSAGLISFVVAVLGLSKYAMMRFLRAENDAKEWIVFPKNTVSN